MSGKGDNHLVKGLKLLGERWTAGPRAWIAAGENLLDTAIRYAMVAAGAYVLWRLVASSWKVLGLAVLVVAIKALRAATKAVKGQPQKAVEVSPRGRREVSRDAFLEFIWETLGDAKAVHLATLADRLTTLTEDRWTGDGIRALCKTHDIPIRLKVRDLGGDRVSSGVHRDDLEPLPQPLPEGGAVAVDPSYVAGQDGNAMPPRYDPTPKTRRVGDLRITSVEDANNPHRTHVTVLDPARRKRA